MASDQVLQHPNRFQRNLLLERGLIKVRWFGVVFALFQILMGTDPLCGPNPAIPLTCEPGYLRPIGYTLAIALGVLNLIALTLLKTKIKKVSQLRNLGISMFSIDVLFLISFTWLYSGWENTTTWVILYILPLEASLRYGMKGALMSIAIIAGAETGRDIFRNQMWGYEYQFVPGTTFRVGIGTIIGLVAGMMARNLDRERQEVEKRADLLSILAEKETAARSEIQAFHQAILAGVSTGNFNEAMQRIVDTIGETLGYDSLAMGLIEDDHPEGPRLRVIAGHRYAPDAIGKSIALDEGICGPVAATGQAAIVNDVEDHRGYLSFTPWTRSELAVPLKVGERIIGVLSAESPVKGAYDQEKLEQLTRLAAQVGVVVENARVLAKEQEAVERLTELDTMKTDFIAITSHELRTPLTVIKGFLQTLQRPEANFSQEQLMSYIEVMDRQATRLSVIVEDLLFVSRIESGEVEETSSPFELKTLISQAIQESFSEGAERIIITGPDHKVTLEADHARLKRVVVSLLDNALKFSPPASSISILLRDLEDRIEVEVQDDGIGIPSTEQELIFERFHQVGGSMKRHQQGFGLGLYICRRVVESMQGSIRVDSTLGQGSTFTVSLPKIRNTAQLRAR